MVFEVQLAAGRDEFDLDLSLVASLLGMGWEESGITWLRRIQHLAARHRSAY